jgi:hypothetical protein
VIVLLDSVDCPPLEALAGEGEEGEEGGGSTVQAPLERRKQLISRLVGEIILAIKEVNTKTRLAAYELLVEVAHAMDGDEDVAGRVACW